MPDGTATQERQEALAPPDNFTDGRWLEKVEYAKLVREERRKMRGDEPPAFGTSWVRRRHLRTQG